MDTQEITARILSGEFDEDLRTIHKATVSRLRAVRKAQTSADFLVGDAVVFNDSCPDTVLRGMHGMVTGREGALVKAVMKRPFPPYAIRAGNRWEPVKFTVQPSSIDRV